jgi:hypothetical protein
LAVRHPASKLIAFADRKPGLYSRPKDFHDSCRNEPPGNNPPGVSVRFLGHDPLGQASN